LDNIKSLTGMQDHFNDGDKDNLSSKFFQVEQKIKEIFINYKLEEIRTPALEDANLFNRSVGNSSDIVNKEIYAFNDRNNKTIALRPEGTASVIRSIIEKKLDQTTHKLWYMGPMWRYERPQKGRYRQFNQAGVEILGIKEGFPEFEMISLVCSIINGFNLKNCSIKINHLGTKENKQTFCDALVQYLLPFKDSLDDKDVERLNKNPLRILDTKSEKTQALLKNAPSIKDYIDQTSIEFLKSIKDQFSDLCDIEIDYSLVRGLDYYSGFVFEAISSELGAQDSFLGGGRYDHLCKKLGGKDLPSIGMALGIERFAELINTDTSSTKTASFLIVTSNLEPKAYKIAHQLRALNKEIILDVHLSDGSLKSKLRRSNKDNADYAIIIGEDELKNNTAVIKYLKDELREQQTVTLDELYSFYKSI
jgi:histidyl-tRNA synthetase